MESPKFDHAIEGSFHAIFAGGLYASGEYIAHHKEAAFWIGSLAVGLVITWAFHRPILRRLKAMAKKIRHKKVYHLKRHERA